MRARALEYHGDSRFSGVVFFRDIDAFERREQFALLAERAPRRRPRRTAAECENLKNRRERVNERRELARCGKMLRYTVLLSYKPTGAT